MSARETMSEIPLDDVVQEGWVMVGEAAKLFGYHPKSIGRIIHKISKQPEGEREMRIRKRQSVWEVWLPDLYIYLEGNNRGPRPKHELDT